MAAKQMTGKWKFHSSENMDMYMKELGVGLMIRKMGNLAKPSLTMEVDDENVFFKSESSFKNIEIKAKIGEEFDENTPDGRKVKTTFTWNEGKLVQSQTWNGKNTKIIRYMDESGDFVTECSMNAINCRRIYKRA